MQNPFYPFWYKKLLMTEYYKKAVLRQRFWIKVLYAMPGNKNMVVYFWNVAFSDWIFFHQNWVLSQSFMLFIMLVQKLMQRPRARTNPNIQLIRYCLYLTCYCPQFQYMVLLSNATMKIWNKGQNITNI